MDLRFILDAYSCAAYVVEYVNKSARDMDNLNRIFKSIDKNPDFNVEVHYKQIGINILKSDEMSDQEILNRRKLYDANIDIDLKAMCVLDEHIREKFLEIPFEKSFRK